MTIALAFTLFLLIRIFGAMVDGYGLRVPQADYETWHWLNWARRDLVLTMIFIAAAMQYLKGNRFIKSFMDRRFIVGLAAVVYVIANYFLHIWFYSLGEYLRLSGF